MQDGLVFPDQFNGYTRIEYMSVFVSFLYALVVSEFFIGWTKMIKSRHKLLISVDHLIYSVLFFWILLLNWWSLWIRMSFLGNGFIYFVLIIIPLAFSYFVTTLMFPDLEKEPDMSTYFDRNFKIIGVGLSLFILINLLAGLVMGEEVGTMITMYRLFNSIFIFAVAIFNLKKLRRIYAFIMAAGLIIASKLVAFV